MMDKTAGRLVVIFLLFLSLRGCSVFTPSGDQCHFSKNDRLERISWGRDVDISLDLHTSVPVKYREAVKEAVQIWNDSFFKAFGRKPFRLSIFSGEVNKGRRNNRSTIAWSEQWDYNREDEYGITTNFFLGSRLQESDIWINGEYFSTSGSLGKAVGTNSDLKSIIIHELGHVLGLSHRDSTASAMYPFYELGTWEQNREKIPEAVIESLRCEYE